MALTGNAVKDTYLDLVQLEQSGAGLPSHGGGPVQLYDGAGVPIVSRLGCYDARDGDGINAASFAETIEGHTPMTNAELVTAGWTMVNCTASVANGCLTLTNNSGGAARVYMYRTVNYTSTFDIVIGPEVVPDVAYGSYNGSGGQLDVYVVDTVGDVVHGAGAALKGGTSGQYGRTHHAHSGTYSTWDGFTQSTVNVNGGAPLQGRVTRIGTGVKLGNCSGMYRAYHDSLGNVSQNSSGSDQVYTLVDSRTFNRLQIGTHANINDGSSVSVLCMRRIA